MVLTTPLTSKTNYYNILLLFEKPRKNTDSERENLFFTMKTLNQVNIICCSPAKRVNLSTCFLFTVRNLNQGYINAVHQQNEIIYHQTSFSQFIVRNLNI